jgi:hypothetical protein
MDFAEEPHGITLLHRPWSVLAMRPFIAALSSANSAYRRLDLAFSTSISRTPVNSDDYIPPNFDFHWQ